MILQNLKWNMKMKKYPKGKSIFWLIYHKQEHIFLILFNLMLFVGGAFLTVRYMEKTAAGIVFFVVCVYGLYFFIYKSLELYKEFKK